MALFQIGRKETQEEKLKRVAGLSKSWKFREAYLGELKCSPLYNCWRAFRFTKKGQKAGCSESWLSYKNFYADMAGSFFIGARLQRIEKNKPFTKENCIWLNDVDSAAIRENVPTLEYNGEVKTLKEWAIKFGVYYPALRQRYYRGVNYSIKEILFGRIRKKKKPLLNAAELKYSSLKLKASKMISAYRCRDKKKGFNSIDITTEWMIENILKKRCIYCDSENYIGCDRLNNDRPHTMENVVPCCVSCNTIRNNNFSFEEMKMLGQTVKLILKNRSNG